MKKIKELLIKLYQTDETFRELVAVRAKKMSEAFETLAAKSAPPPKTEPVKPSLFPHKKQALSHKEAITMVLEAAGQEGLTNLEIRKGLEVLQHNISQGSLNTIISELKKLDYLIGIGPRGNNKYYLNNLPATDLVIANKVYRSKGQ